MRPKDFTVAEAARWVAQEFAKVTKANAAQRAASEEQMIKFAAQMGNKFPVSDAAHRELLDKVRAAYLSPRTSEEAAQ